MMRLGNALNHNEFIQGVDQKNPGEDKLQQAVDKVTGSVIPFMNEHQILKRMTGLGWTGL
jgi:hypothetical protein